MPSVKCILMYEYYHLDDFTFSGLLDIAVWGHTQN
jgi:hypothetical protein